MSAKYGRGAKTTGPENEGPCCELPLTISCHIHLQAQYYFRLIDALPILSYSCRCGVYFLLLFFHNGRI